MTTEPTPPSITCPRCHRTSYNPNDVRERYCGACHDYHPTELRLAPAEVKALLQATSPYGGSISPFLFDEAVASTCLSQDPHVQTRPVESAQDTPPPGGEPPP